MSEPKRIAAKLKDALSGLFKVKTRQVGGLLGDGTTEQRVIVSGATQRVWFRPDPYPNALWQPIHLKSNVPLFHGMAAIAEFNESDGEWYIQQIDRKKYAEQEDFELRYVPAHARQHSINEDSIPSDPTWIYRRGVVMLRGSVLGDSSLRVFIQPGDLPFTTNTYWPGGFTADQTGNLPAGGNQVWLTISLTSSLTIDVNVGSEFAEGLSLINAPPDPDAGNVPICYVLLSDDTSEITETIIWDARRTVGTFSDPLTFANPTAQVGLSAVNGAATTAMRSDAAPALDQGIIPTWTGLHTHQADIVMDGADVDLNGEQLVIDEDGDSYIVELVDDVIYLYIGASLTLAWSSAGMAMAASKSISLGGNADALILDLDEDTTISAPTDDEIDIEVGGADIAEWKAGGLYGAAAMDVYPQADEYPLFDRVVDVQLSPDEHFNTGYGILNAWAGAPFVTPTTSSFSFKSIALIHDSTPNNRAFRYETVSLAAGVNARCRARLQAGSFVEFAGLRLDDGSDNNYIEFGIRSLGVTSGLAEMISRYRLGGGAVTTTVYLSGLMLGLQFYVLDLQRSSGDNSNFRALVDGVQVVVINSIVGGIFNFTITRRGITFETGGGGSTAFGGFFDWFRDS